MPTKLRHRLMCAMSERTKINSKIKYVEPPQFIILSKQEFENTKFVVTYAFLFTKFLTHFFVLC